MARVNCFKLEFLQEFVKEDNYAFFLYFLVLFKAGGEF